MVQHWQVPFLGLQEIPPELTDFEIRYFFTFTAKEREAIFSRYGDHHRLAVALQIGMIKTMLAGARMLLVAEPNGTVARTSSPYVDGRRVTLLEVDLDEVLKDETLLPRLQAAKTQDEAKAIVKAAQGLKINLDRDITIEFTPAK